MVDWFRRFGDIPGVTYEPPSGVDRRRLSGHDAVPETQVFDFEGKRRETLRWPAGGGGGSASPAHGRAFGDSRDASTADLLKNVYQGLELPGEPSDYHFLIQGCADELWGRRRQEPKVLGEVEKLCWLDVQLIQARPDAVSDKFGEEPRFYSVPTFSILIGLYEREGFLYEALDVAERALVTARNAKRATDWQTGSRRWRTRAVSESDGLALWLALSSSSFLEFAFLRWVLAPAALPGLASHIAAQAEVEVDGRRYRIERSP